MLLPYNVDRPARRLPIVTYSLMGINIFVFLLTIIISNINLPADRIVGKNAIQQVLTQYRSKLTQSERDMVDQLSKKPSPESGGSNQDDFYATLRGQTSDRILAAVALSTLLKQENKTREDLAKFYQIQHSQDRMVLEPHYSVINIFAYRPAEPSFWGKILGVFGSMFLHGDFMHLAGNMLFLWVFGRAVEDALGRGIYIGSYVLCGVAAVLLNHIISTQFMRDSTQIAYYLGASGAIAGVMGTFALRFYRTPVRTFYMFPWAIPIALIAFLIMAVALVMLFGDPYVALAVAAVATIAGFITLGKEWCWGRKLFPAAGLLGVYIALFDLRPAIRSLFDEEARGGVAHWAHIGGFLFGLLYSALIGGKQEGAQEYLLEDAQKAIESKDAPKAIERAQGVLEREPANGEAMLVLAQAYDHQNNEENALDHYEQAIEMLLKAGERSKAAGAYLQALHKHPAFIMPAGVQSALGAQMARESRYQDAAETLVKIPYTFPDASESEVSLLRSAQLYLEHLNQPEMALQLLTDFFNRYPQTEWMPQATRAWKIAQFQLNPETQPVEEAAPATPQAPTRERPTAMGPPQPRM